MVVVVVVVVIIAVVVVIVVVVVAAVALRGRIFCVFYLCLLNTNYMYIFASNR